MIERIQFMSKNHKIFINFQALICMNKPANWQAPREVEKRIGSDFQIVKL